MEIPRDAILLRIFVGELDRSGGRSLHCAIVQAAFTSKLAGATVFHGPLSYGHGNRVNDEVLCRRAGQSSRYRRNHRFRRKNRSVSTQARRDDGHGSRDVGKSPNDARWTPDEKLKRRARPGLKGKDASHGRSA